MHKLFYIFALLFLSCSHHLSAEFSFKYIDEEPQDYLSKDYYISGFTGTNHVLSHVNNLGFINGVTFGHKFCPNIRIEWEISTRINPESKHYGRRRIERSWAFNTNALYDLTNTSSFIPYLGTGISIIHYKGWLLGLEPIIGIRNDINEELGVYLEGRYSLSRREQFAIYIGVVFFFENPPLRCRQVEITF